MTYYQVGNVHFFQEENIVRQQLVNLFNNQPYQQVAGRTFSDTCSLFEWCETEDEEFWAEQYYAFCENTSEGTEEWLEVVEEMKNAVEKYLTENGAGHLLPFNNPPIPDDLLWE